MTILRSKLRLAVTLAAALAVVPVGLLVNTASAETNPPARQDVVRTDAGLVASKAVGQAGVFDGFRTPLPLWARCDGRHRNR